jgi:hypothetical protein
MNKVRSSIVILSEAAGRPGVCYAPRIRQQGVALALVVWFLAAMSLLVAGIVSQARVDTRLAQVHLGGARAVAAGDGAINLFLAQVTARGRDSSGDRSPLVGEYQLGGQAVSVSMVSARGLIDLRTAPNNVLAAMFSLTPGVGADEAQRMADSVVQLRMTGFGFTPRGTTRRPPLRTLEDLLRVEGVNRRELDAVRDLVTIGGGGIVGIDLKAAPANVRAIYDSVLRDGRDGPAGQDNNTGIQPGGGRVARGGEYRVDALVRQGNRMWLRRRWVSLGARDGHLPWRFFRTEAARVVGVVGAQ